MRMCMSICWMQQTPNRRVAGLCVMGSVPGSVQGSGQGSVEGSVESSVQRPGLGSGQVPVTSSPGESFCLRLFEWSG